MMGTTGQHAAEMGEARFAGRVCVVGVGDGGSHAVHTMAENWPEGPSLFVINTDAVALRGTTNTTPLQIGAKLAGGLGTGGDVNLGRSAAEESYEELRSLFGGMELCFLVVGLGGGTGTGAAPVVARAAHEGGALVLAFATLPFAFEGEARMLQAQRGLRELREEADVVVVVPNERLFEDIDPQATAPQAFHEADSLLGMGVVSLWKLLMHRGEMRLDFGALRQVARSIRDGVAVFGHGESAGSNRAEEAVRAALQHPLLERGRAVAEAAAVLVSILGAPDLTLREINTIMDTIRAHARGDAQLLMGTAIDPRWQDRVAVTVIVAERWSPPERDAGAVDGAESGPGTADKKKRKPAQPQLELNGIGRGIFKDVEPTILDGQDLDIPTFIRRGVVIDK